MAIFNSYVKLPEGKFGIDQTCFFSGIFSEPGRVYKAKIGSLWGRGLVTWKCTPRKTGAVLEPCWNLSLLGCKGGLMWGCNLQGFHTGYEQFWEKESQVWPRSCVNKYGNGASYFFSVRMPYQTLGKGFCHVLAVEWVAGWCFHLLVNKWHKGPNSLLFLGWLETSNLAESRLVIFLFIGGVHPRKLQNALNFHMGRVGENGVSPGW